EIIGTQYLNELYAVYDDVSDIDITKIPKSFVLKGTHGSGYNLICKNKYHHDWKKEKKKMKRWLTQNYYWSKREWVYKDIKPRIVCERYLSEAENSSCGLTDYKFYCFNGVPHFCQIIRGRGGQDMIDFYNMEWEHMPFVGMRLLTNSNDQIKKPKAYNEMIDLSKMLSKGFSFVRVDCYYVDNRIYFGEMTFFPTSGMGKFNPPEWNRKLGQRLILPETK